MAFKKAKDKEITPMTVGTVISLLDHNTINLNPVYQRTSVWKREQKVYLLDSIIRDYDVPKLYFLKLKDDTYDVVDGQQRIRALNEFIKGEFALTTEGFDGMRFGDLPPKVRNTINEFELHIVELTGDRWSDEVIRDIFRRLQKGTPLNPAEKRRALTGNVSQIVAELASSPLFAESSQIPDSRFGYEDAAAKMLHLVLNGEKHGITAGAVEKMYEANRNIALNDKRVLAIKRAMQFLAKAFKGNPYFKKYSILSVTTALVELQETYSYSERHGQVADILTKVEEDRIQNDKLPAGDPRRDPELAQLTAAARSDRTDHLRWRKQFYAEKLLEAKPAPLDPSRRFDKTVLSILLRKQAKKCASCGKAVDARTAEIDHIVAHSRGGETDIANAQLLCVECNRSKGAR